MLLQNTFRESVRHEMDRAVFEVGVRLLQYSVEGIHDEPWPQLTLSFDEGENSVAGLFGEREEGFGVRALYSEVGKDVFDEENSLGALERWHDHYLRHAHSVLEFAAEPRWQ